MPAPVTTTYYCSTSSFGSTTHGALTPVAPPTPSNTTIGWNVRTLNPPQFSEMNWGQEVVGTDVTHWLPSPTGSRPNMSATGSGAGNCFVMGPFNGEFLRGPWNITMSVIAVNNSSTHTGRFIYRIWQGSDLSGSNASLVTSSFLSSSIVTINSTSVGKSLSGSFLFPGINLRDEYVFLHTQWSIVTAGGNSNADNDFVMGTGSVVNPTPFVGRRQQTVRWNSGDFS